MLEASLGKMKLVSIGIPSLLLKKSYKKESLTSLYYCSFLSHDVITLPALASVSGIRCSVVAGLKGAGTMRFGISVFNFVSYINLFLNKVSSLRYFI